MNEKCHDTYEEDGGEFIRQKGVISIIHEISCILMTMMYFRRTLKSYQIKK